MARFTGIPSIPQAGIDEWQARVLDAMKQNVELLTGQRGEATRESEALLKGTVTVTMPVAQFRALSARGDGLTISTARVPSLSDYTNLLRDVALISNDLAALRATMNTLLSQLKG